MPARQPAFAPDVMLSMHSSRCTVSDTTPICRCHVTHSRIPRFVASAREYICADESEQVPREGRDIATTLPEAER
jgi:hypothetical protein